MRADGHIPTQMLSFTRRATVSSSAPLTHQLGVLGACGEEPSGPAIGWGQLAYPWENFLNCSKSSFREDKENIISAHKEWGRLECRPEVSCRSGQLSCSGALTKATRSSSLGEENKFLGIPVRTRSAPGYTRPAPAVLTLIYFYSDLFLLL